jgi:TonB family protein
MRQDYLISIILHVMVVLTMVVSVPFKPRVKTDLGDVIRVNLASLPQSMMPNIAKPAVLPKATSTEKIATPISTNKSADKAKAIEKSKAKKKEEIKNKPGTEVGKEDKFGTAEGQKDVSDNLGSGSIFGGAAIDNANFNYPYWFVQAFNKIERNWRNPVYAQQPLSCIIYFQVIRSGKIMDVQIEKSSGIDTFDRACERAVKLSEPLPQLPREFVEEILGIHLEFPYIP